MGSRPASTHFASPGGWRLIGRTSLRLFGPTSRSAPSAPHG
ncbi:MAG: carboxyltransferase domain-containing protein [Ignavibacteriota bacterium]